VPNRGEVRGARLVEVVGDEWSREDEVLLPVDLAVEYPNGVRVEALPAVLVELVDVRLEVCDQLLPVRGTAHLVADGVQVEDDVAQAPSAQERVGQLDDLDVGVGSSRPEYLDAEHAELAEPRGLGSAVPVIRMHVVRLERSRQLLGVGQEGANDRRSALRTERHRSPTLVLEGEHLFRDDVRRVSRCACEELGLLERRRLDVPVAKTTRELVRLVVEREDRVRTRRQQIRRSPRRLELH
jgi:hypothetical protein